MIGYGTIFNTAYQAGSAIIDQGTRDGVITNELVMKEMTARNMPVNAWEVSYTNVGVGYNQDLKIEFTSSYRIKTLAIIGLNITLPMHVQRTKVSQVFKR